VFEKEEIMQRLILATLVAGAVGAASWATTSTATAAERSPFQLLTTAQVAENGAPTVATQEVTYRPYYRGYSSGYRGGYYGGYRGGYSRPYYGGYRGGYSPYRSYYRPYGYGYGGYGGFYRPGFSIGFGF